jgi:hypothetical protein
MCLLTATGIRLVGALPLRHDVLSAGQIRWRIPPPDPGALKCERQRSLAELSILVVAETECQRWGPPRSPRWGGTAGSRVSCLCYSPGFDLPPRAAVFTGVFGLFPKISTTVENTVENIEGLMS